MNYSQFKRIEKLKDEVVNSTPYICVDRIRGITRAYKENEAQPNEMKRALALREILKGMRISIMDGELLVGNQASSPRSAPLFPEYSWDWIAEEIDTFEKRPGDRFVVKPEDRDEILELLQYWKGKTYKDKVIAMQPPEVLSDRKIGVLGWQGNVTAGQGHIVVDYENLVKRGLRYYIDYANERLKGLNLTQVEDLKQKAFLQAIPIGLQAVIDYSHRFADLAEEKAGTETDEARRNELLQIAHNCRKVPENKPDTFWEALQAVWFIHLCLQIESNGHSMSLGRLDQYLYPFYKADAEKGTLDQKKAMELIECLYVKLFTINKVRCWEHTRLVSGYPTYQNIVVGGQSALGVDATNELSYVMVEALGEIRLSEPNFYVRYHEGIPKDFMKLVINVIKYGFGMPAIVNDKVVLLSLVNRGVALEDALNYCTMGCLEVQVPGKWGYRENGKSKFNLAKILEMALNDGCDPVSGITLCKGIGKLEDFKSFDEVMDAWKRQLHYYMELQVKADNVNDYANENLVPDILCSALVQDCIKRGKHIMQGGAVYDMMSGCQVGIVTVGNSLQAIKELVFEKGKLTGKELHDALDADFRGVEGKRIQALLKNGAKKYGNDDDEVDRMVKEAFDPYVNGIVKYKNTRYGRGPIGGHYLPATVTISANVPCGKDCNATPDGRNAHEPVNDGVSPVHGTELYGPTAVINSVTKLPTVLMTGGQLLNMRFNRKTLETADQVEKFYSLIRTFCGNYGWHMQFNMISTDVLKDAKKHPENYKDLVIRVAGYSALFVSLDPIVQEDIISRMEYEL
jgi:formate C-acetyltransferase